MAMFDFGKALMTLGFDAKKIDLKRPVYLIKLVISSLIRLLLLDWI